MKWDKIITNGIDPEPVLLIKNLLKFRRRVMRLHAIIKADVPGQFHSHPSRSFRIVLKGGYVEQMEDGSLKAWRPGSFGYVSPHLVHRIHELLDGPSWTLWFRGKPRWPTWLKGPGWPDHIRDRAVHELDIEKS